MIRIPSDQRPFCYLIFIYLNIFPQKVLSNVTFFATLVFYVPSFCNQDGKYTKKMF